MLPRSLMHVAPAAFVSLAMSLCLPDVSRADDKAEWNAAFDEAAALYQKGELPGAAKAYERALELSPRIFGPEHEGTAAVMNNLANVYRDMDQYAKAESLYEQSLKIRESRLGPNHPEVAASLYNLASLYDRMGHYAQAVPLCQRSLKIRESQLGPDHPKVAWSLNNLASLYDRMGQYDQAEPLYQRSLKIKESKFGPDHPEVAASLNNLAILYDKLGQYARAEPLYQRSLKIWQSSFGPDHPALAKGLEGLAGLYLTLGRYDQAEPLYQRSLKIRESRLGPDHRDVAASLNNLAVLYYKTGQYDQAESCYRRSLTIWESKLGPEHPLVAESLNNLAGLYLTIGQYAPAEPLLQRSLKIRQSQLSPDHPLVAETLNRLAILYYNMDQYDKAESLFQQSLTIWESKLGPDHPDVAVSLNNLANLYQTLGQYARAEPLYQRSLQIRQSQLGPDHPDVAAFGLHSLAMLHAATERWSEVVAEIDKERRIVRRHVARTLPSLNEREQLVFLQTQDEKLLHVALSLGLRQRANAQDVLRSAGWILNGKAVAQEVLAQRAVLTTEGTDPALADLVKQLMAVRSRLASLFLAAPKQGQHADHRKQLETLSRQEQELSRQLGQASGRSTTGDPWIEPHTVQRALAKEALLIEIARFKLHNWKAKGKENYWLAPHYVGWLIPAEGQGPISIVDLGEAPPIDEAVAQTRKALQNVEMAIRQEGEAKTEKQLRDAMGDLARLVFEPLEQHLGNARELILSPDAALWLVPWGAIPLADGRYTIEKYQIRYVISGRDLVSPAANGGPKTTDPILFANPDYDLAPSQVEAATRAVLRSAPPLEQVASSRGAGGWSSLPRVGRLPGTAEEAAAIKPSVTRYANAEPTVYEDQYAVEGVFKAIHRPKVLVLSTHGFFMPDQEVASKNERMTGLAGEDSQSRGVLTTEGKPLENPLLRCGLLLAGCNRRADDAPGGVDDGILTGLEIVGTDLRGTNLVVLSACETGLGQVRNGEGVAGLRQAFHLAGAKAVVSTLWQIPDQETVQLMTDFFANLSAGQTKADALRGAQLSQIKSRRENNSAAHPYYWAAFTLTGE